MSGFICEHIPSSSNEPFQASFLEMDTSSRQGLFPKITLRLTIVLFHQAKRKVAASHKETWKSFSAEG